MPTEQEWLKAKGLLMRASVVLGSLKWTKSSLVSEIDSFLKRQKIDLDADRPHGENPAIFNGPCDCDECQLWDQMQRESDSNE